MPGVHMPWTHPKLEVSIGQVATLAGAMLHEGLLDGMWLVHAAHMLDRGHFQAIHPQNSPPETSLEAENSPFTSPRMKILKENSWKSMEQHAFFSSAARVERPQTGIRQHHLLLDAQEHRTGAAATLAAADLRAREPQLVAEVLRQAHGQRELCRPQQLLLAVHGELQSHLARLTRKDSMASKHAKSMKT